MDARTPHVRPVTSAFHQRVVPGRLPGEPLGRTHTLPSLPIPPAEEPRQSRERRPRSAYRVHVALQALVQWQEPGPPRVPASSTGVLADLSGSGAKLFLRHVPASGTVSCTLTPPDAFIDEQARRQLSRGRAAVPGRYVWGDRWSRTCERISASFANIEASVVHAEQRGRDAHGPIYALSLAFPEPREGCYRLVRYLERQGLQQEARDKDALQEAAAA